MTDAMTPKSLGRKYMTLNDTKYAKQITIITPVTAAAKENELISKNAFLDTISMGLNSGVVKKLFRSPIIIVPITNSEKISARHPNRSFTTNSPA
jgi:hypothetical protein